MAASGYLMVLALIAQLSEGRYAYVLAEPFFYPGGCDSAAQIGARLALACKAGIWLGPPDDLQLTLACLGSEEQPNRVRRLDDHGFIAATPCGLYLINLSGDVERVPLPAEPPSALDTDAHGRLVVAADGWLWSWSLQHPSWLRFGPEASEQPQRIEFADDQVLRVGQSAEVIGLLDGQREQVLEDDSLHALLADERVLSVDESGRVWLGGIIHREGSVRHLDLLAHENIEAVLGWGAQALICTTARILLVGSETSVSLLLPGNGGDWIPVRGRDGLPWLIGPGGLYRPALAAPGTRPAVGDAEIDWAAWYRPHPSYREAASAWTLLLPRIELSAGGMQRHTYLNRSDSGRVDHREDVSFVGWLMVVWDLTSPRYQTYLNEYEILTRELRQVDSERIARVGTTVRNWINPSDPTDSDGLAREEFKTQLEILLENQ
jgi:hypothetical protein